METAHCRGACRGQRKSDVPGLGMEKGLSNLAFPRLNLSSMRSCESVDVELWGGEQILTMCQKAVRHTAMGMQLKSIKRDPWRRTEGVERESLCKMMRSERRRRARVESEGK